jgi:type I restriction enzyme R subunit
MKMLRDPAFQGLLVTYPRPPRVFYVAPEVIDQVESEWVIRDGAGHEYKPEDYLAAFSRFVTQNPTQIEAIRILLDRPRDWSSAALDELGRKLVQTPERFSMATLQRAHQVCHGRALVDIISMVKHAANATAPLLTAAERVQRAVDTITRGHTFTADQQNWLERIRTYLVEALAIDAADFNLIPIFDREGGLAAARRAFGPQLDPLLRQLNEAIAA